MDIPALTVPQIRAHRLRAHNLDRVYPPSDVLALAGACGFQNTPPGAWETAAFCRAPGCKTEELERLLYRERSLVQAWGIRGIPMVFPEEESGAFLSALCPKDGEPWIYTQGIGLALEFLGMSFEELLAGLTQVISGLDFQVIPSKESLDRVLAEWMEPLIPKEKLSLWRSPSMYGNPERQTVGGAAVSFLLRPCSFLGLVVFGERRGNTPDFTSYENWLGHGLLEDRGAERRLVKKFLHCYGPANADMVAAWLGCSGKQARRMMKAVGDETEPVEVLGKQMAILTEDRESLLSQPEFGRELLLLGGHDPYLDQRDRLILQPDKSLHRRIWRMVGNPGVIVYRGEAAGIWNSAKKGRGMEIRATLWRPVPEPEKLEKAAQEYAAFRNTELIGWKLE